MPTFNKCCTEISVRRKEHRLGINLETGRVKSPNRDNRKLPLRTSTVAVEADGRKTTLQSFDSDLAVRCSHLGRVVLMLSTCFRGGGDHCRLVSLATSSSVIDNRGYD